MLDADIAALYGVATKRLNEQVRRNLGRFPADFSFRLSVDEWAALMWSQIATTSRRRRLDNRPYAYTEHGCLMLANTLKSKRAVEVSVLVVRAFVRLRTILKLLEDIRRLTHFPAPRSRPIGFTAKLEGENE